MASGAFLLTVWRWRGEDDGRALPKRENQMKGWALPDRGRFLEDEWRNGNEDGRERERDGDERLRARARERERGRVMGKLTDKK